MIKGDAGKLVSPFLQSKTENQKMVNIPRQQVIPFTVLPGREVDLTFNTKYDHDKVVGVVLLPDKNIHGDTIFLEINREKILPRGFNAGLIAFRQFLNKDITLNTYSFEEWARGSDIRIIYKNNDRRRGVNIDMVLFTVIGDTQPITKRKKLQIVPVPYYGENSDNPVFLYAPTPDESVVLGVEPCEVRTKTDYYFQEFIGFFVDYYVNRQIEPESPHGNLVRTIFEFVNFYYLFIEDGKEEEAQEAAVKIKEKLEDEKELTVLDLDGKPITDRKYINMINIMKNAMKAYFNNVQIIIAQKDLNSLQDVVEYRYLYNDKYQSFSTIELTVGGVPIYPDNYPIANITPRYRKSFNETMYRTQMEVQEADIFIRFKDLNIRYDPILSKGNDGYYNYFQTIYRGEKKNFSVYFLYNQISKRRINP